METYKLADRIPHDCTLTISVSAPDADGQRLWSGNLNDRKTGVFRAISYGHRDIISLLTTLREKAGR